VSIAIETSPHISKPGKLGDFMLQVLLAAIPGVLVLIYFFGIGVILNIIIASASAIFFEALILKIRQKNILLYLSDLSAVVTAVLLAIALPPTLPWWITVVGTGFAIVFAKHLYGGLGSNPFNPAMVAYVLLLISYPLEMTTWLPANTAINSQETLQAVFLLDKSVIDAYSGATPLDSFRTGLIQGLNKTELLDNAVFNGIFTSAGWGWVNLAFLLGGIYLYFKKIINWHISVSFLLAIFLMSSACYLFDPDRFSSPLFHLFSGGTMLGAFFIATDPVSAATSNKGRFIYGFSIGTLIIVIRTWGGYPDAIAFSVLLLNLCAPTIDFYTQPRTYGYKNNSHEKKSTTKNKD
jgi:electron transport complex protein RnfD